MKRLTASSALIFAALMANTSSFAATVTGTIDSSITLLSACEVNGSPATNGTDFGSLDFGAQSTFFNSATAQVQSGTGSAIEVRCAPGSDATLTITSGQHDSAVAGSGRALSSGAKFVPYDIYRDAALQNVLANGATISILANGAIQQVPIYGRALGNAGLTPGTYTDTIAVTLDF